MFDLLRTKTSIPPTRPRQVERSRLLGCLWEGVLRALTLVVAPAGFGKTTLVAGWAQTGSLPVTWLSLESADQSPSRFLSYLIQALQQDHPQVGQTALAILQSRQALSTTAVLHSLVNDLSDLPADIAIVLDDYHAVDCPEICEILQFLLEKRPTQVHLILVTRTKPGLNLARLRALDQVIEITASDLRFTSQEVQQFLDEVMSIQLTPDELVRLSQTTEGWAVGLQLAALAHTRQSPEWAAPDGQEHIFEYLAEEVLRREPEHIQEALLRLALFDRFSLPLCELLLEQPPLIDQTAAGLLDYAEQANLFLIRLDAGGNWYRFHALFADFLRQQLEQQKPELAARLYRAGSQWFEKNAMLDEAIHYAVHTGDQQSTEHAAALIGRHYRDMLLRGEQSALLAWISELPPELVDRRPRLWLAKGWANVIQMDSSDADRCARQAEAAIPDGDHQAELRGEIEALRILSGIFQGKIIPEEQISKAFILLSEQDHFLHSILHFNLGMMHVLSGESRQALEDFQETLQLVEKLNNPLITIFTWTQMGEQYQVCGELGLSEQAFQQCIAYTKKTLGERSLLLGLPYVSYAELLREQNRFEEALRFAELGISYCLLWQPTASLDGNIALARLRAGQGRWAEACACFERGLEVAAKSDTILDDKFVTAHKVRTQLLHGDLLQAMQEISRYNPEQDFGPGFYHMHEMARLVMLRAELLGAESNPTRMAELAKELEALIPEIEQRQRISPLIEALILQAYALHGAGEHPRAVNRLKRALHYGAQSGYVRLFADEGRRLQRLLEQYRSKLDPSAWLDTLLKLMKRDASHTGRKESGAAGDLMPFTRRELEILILVADGKSNQEIADELVLALNTVKKHVANILGKLGVSNRTQAVTQARSRKWLE
ncbi:MAG: tetratricopeptide repeat protein [Anaerolineales bacterium]|nr:tetratricopeptide repeat protein [Anaerolineales bacterium]